MVTTVKSDKGAGWAALPTTHQFGLATKLKTARCRSAAAWIKTRKGQQGVLIPSIGMGTLAPFLRCKM